MPIVMNETVAIGRRKCASARVRIKPGTGKFTVNGKPIEPTIANEYTVIERDWRAGDTVRLELPLPVQRVRADERVAADRGRQPSSR